MYIVLKYPACKCLNASAGLCLDISIMFVQLPPRWPSSVLQVITSYVVLLAYSNLDNLQCCNIFPNWPSYFSSFSFRNLFLSGTIYSLEGYILKLLSLLHFKCHTIWGGWVRFAWKGKDSCDFKCRFATFVKLATIDKIKHYQFISVTRSPWKTLRYVAKEKPCTSARFTERASLTCAHTEIGQTHTHTHVWRHVRCTTAGLPGACNWQMPISVVRKEAFWILLYRTFLDLK